MRTVPLIYKSLSIKFKQIGINVNNPRYGAWWEANAHLKAAYQYNQKWNMFLSQSVVTRDAAMKYGRQLAESYGLIFRGDE